MRTYKLYIALAFLVPFVSCNPEEEKTGNGTSITVTVQTGEVTDIDPTSAKLNASCSITNAKGTEGIACFYYSCTDDTAKNIKKNGTCVQVGHINNAGETFSTFLTGLNPDTKYYYMAAVSIDGEEYYSIVSSFSTKEKSNGLTATGPAMNITEFRAILSGYANLTPDLWDVTMGILYSKEENPSLANSIELTSKELDGNNMFTVLAQYLECNTTYYYKSFVKYGGVYRFGEVRSFTTRDFSAYVTTIEASDIGSCSAKLNATLSIDSVESLDSSVQFIYSTDESSLDITNNRISATHDNNGTFWRYVLLKPNTTYYYIACAKVKGRMYYGETKCFTTSNFKVITDDVTSINDFEVTFHGSLDINDNDTFMTDCIRFTQIKVDIAFGTTPESLTISDDWLFCHRTFNDYDFSFGLSSINFHCNTTYYYAIYATVTPDFSLDSYIYSGEVKSFTTKDFALAAVDIGLSVKWANANLGAMSPEKCGDRYAWGETETKSEYSWKNYKWCNGSSTTLTKYNTQESDGIVDNKVVLEDIDDIAHLKLGGRWRMPTRSELNELISTWNNPGYGWRSFKLDGVKGWLITYYANNNSIFLPTIGDINYRFYWSSSLSTNTPSEAYTLDALEFPQGITTPRDFSGLIRPVTE